jgi:hypothetical protein
MKKQLLIITLLLSGYVGTSQAMKKEAGIKSFFPEVLKQGEAVEVDMHSGLKSKSDNSSIAHIIKTDFGQKVTGVRTGKGMFSFFDDKGNVKYTKPVEVAASSVSAIQSIKVGEKKHAERKEGEKFIQTNLDEKDAGRVSINHKKNDLVSFLGRKVGRVEVESKDTGVKNWIMVGEKANMNNLLKNDAENVKGMNK